MRDCDAIIGYQHWPSVETTQSSLAALNQCNKLKTIFILKFAYFFDLSIVLDLSRNFEQKRTSCSYRFVLIKKESALRIMLSQYLHSIAFTRAYCIIKLS